MTEKTPVLLVVDDRPDNLFIIEQLVNEYIPECIVHTAANADIAFQIAQELQPDGILSDIQMPGKNGIELCRLLKRTPQTSDIPVLLITSHKSYPHLRVQGLEAGADDFIARPIDNLELAARIKVMFRIKHMQDELITAKRDLEKTVAERTENLKRANDQLILEIEDRKQAEEALRQSEATVRKKLKAIIEPEGDISTLELSDIIDIEVLQSIMEDFYRLTGMLGAVLDVSGKVLIAIGWQDICTKFHRCHPDTLKNCTESDTILTSGVLAGTVKAYHCKNNMWDMVTPIMVGGRHVGNVFIGQFFYEDETPDVEAFREQARRNGFDETEYLAALDRVPRFSRETVDAGMQFYAKLAGIISTLSFSTIRQSRMFAERKQAEKEREKLQGQLAQAQKMEAIGTLAGGIAHDFNNILSAILGFAQIAKDGAGKGSDLEDDLNEIYKAGIRAKDLVAQILTFARQSDEEISPLRVDIILKEVTKFIRSSIPTSIEIKSTINSKALIMGNQTQMHQIFMNLFTNASHAMEANEGLLEVSLEDTQVDNGMILKYPDLKFGNYIKITVSDTGTGIPKDIMDSIFEPYFTTKYEGEGTGMGLAMVHGIVESYGGKIFVSSELGKGTVFTIYLPVTEKKETYESSESENLLKGTERILLIDDELPIVKLSQRVLESLGYQVTTQTNSIEALELFESKPEHFDLVITDMTMPGLTGDKLAKTMLEIRPELPIILCSGYSKKLSVNPILVSHIKAVLNKPITKINLAQTVREVLDKTKNI
jgi:polar amino acid transport system substrate-binding protein